MNRDEVEALIKLLLKPDGELARTIIDKAKEEALLSWPEVVGNLMQNQASIYKMNAEFYKKYKEFVGHQDVVMSVVEEVEGQNPIEEYDAILEKAVPLIRERIGIKKKVNIDSNPKEPSRNLNGIL